MAKSRNPRSRPDLVAAAGCLAAALAIGCGDHAFAWDQEGHSIVAEIAQRRLSPAAAAAVERVLGRGHSLASVASWADDYYRKALPILDRQLGMAGLRLARFLNDAYGSAQCPVQ